MYSLRSLACPSTPGPLHVPSLRFQGPRLHTQNTAQPPRPAPPALGVAGELGVPAAPPRPCSFPGCRQAGAAAPARDPRRSEHESGSSETTGRRSRGGAWSPAPIRIPAASSRMQNPAAQSEPRRASGESSAPYHFHHAGYLLHGDILIRARQHFQHRCRWQPRFHSHCGFIS